MALFAAGMLVSAASLAQDGAEPVINDKTVCVDAHAWGQQLRIRGGYREAEKSFVVCSSNVCPAVIRAECVQWLGEIRTTMPTAVVVAFDAAGRETAEVKTYLDDKLIAERAAGLPVRLDAGEHVLRFVSADGRTIERSIIIRAGQKNRRLVVRFAEAPLPVRPAPAGASEPKESPHPAHEEPAREQDSSAKASAVKRPIGYGLLTLGAAGFVSATYFGLDAKSDERDLMDTCAPNCAQSDVDPMRRKYLVSDISLGVGVVAAGVGVWLLVSGDGESADASSAWVDVSPTVGGGVVAGGGTF